MELQQDYFPQAEELNDAELLLLGIIAYIGEHPTNTHFKRVLKNAGMAEKDHEDIVRSLLEKNLIFDGNYYAYTYMKVRADLIFPLIFHIVYYHPVFAEIYKKSVPSDAERDYKTVKYWNIVKAIRMDDCKTLSSLTASAYYMGSIDPTMCRKMMLEPAFRPIVLSLNYTSFSNLIMERMKKDLEDNLPMKDTDQMHDLISDHEKSDRLNSWNDYSFLHDTVTAHKFFYDAEPPQWKHSAQTDFSYAIEAIIQLYQGNYTSAFSLFRKSFSIRNKRAKDKDVYSNPVLAYYWMLCCAFMGEVGKKCAETYLSKSFVQSRPTLFASSAVARHLVLNRDSSGQGKSITDYILACNKDFLSFSFAGIIGYALEYSSDEVNIEKNAYPFVSDWALLRYEAAAYTGITDRAVLQSRLEGSPIISRIQRKPQWEQALEDLSSIISSSKSNGTSYLADDKRIVYEIEENGYIIIREQKLTKKGSWSSGVNMSYNLQNFYKRPSMDEMDNALAKVIRSKGYSFTPNVSQILPHLIGCDRVYSILGGKSHPVTVSEETFFIELDETATGIRVNCNLDASMIAPGNVVRRDSFTHYSVFNLSKEEADIASRMLSIKEFPLQAKPLLTAMMGNMSKKVEVHSSLIENGSLLEKKDSDSRINIRLYHEDDFFHLHFGVQPLEAGGLFLMAGRGSETVYDSANGVRYQISRKLSEEQANYDHLMNFCQTSLSSLSLREEDKGEMSLADTLALMEFVGDNPDKCVVEWPKGESLRLKGKLTSASVSGGVNTGESWFEIEGDVQLDKNTIMTLQDLMKQFAGSGSRRFVQLADGEFLALTEELRRKLLRLQDIQSASGKVPLFQVGALASMIQSKDNFLTADKGFGKLLAKVNKAGKMDIGVPTTLNAQLRDYQQQGFEWMTRLFEWGAGACLADDMGLGKTIQAISAILYRKGPALVVAPASVILNWVNEITRFAPTLRCTVLNEADDRAAVIESAGQNDVILCSYAILTRESELLGKKQWSIACLDEAHTIKNKETKMSDAAMALKADARLALTGTPLQNNLAELWNLFQFINPGLLGTHQHFSQKYISSDSAKDNMKRLKNVIGPFILRRRKYDVADELPEKTDIRHNVQLDYLETASYEAMRLEAKAEIDAAENVDMTALAHITRLRQAACSMELVKNDWNGANSKISEACTIIRQVVESGDRILVFSQFTSFLSLVRDALGMKESVLYLDGSTPIRRRAMMVNDFQEGKASVFFISLKAGGLGLNLTGANYVLHLDPWWNPAIEQQATDRAHRIGQKRIVTVYHLISSNTIEEKILRLHKVKRDMADALLSGTDVAQSLSIEQLKELVSDTR